MISPTADEWRALTPAERDQFLVAALDALDAAKDPVAEGRPHKLAVGRAMDLLSLYFGTLGRAIYLAEELAVVYPEEPMFSPDILAVLDVPQPEEDERLAWVVADEGRGPDLVLEVLHRGDRRKDLVDNVARYARLGISEYFVYDHAQQRIHAFRLAPSAARYDRILPQRGRHRSEVLGLDLTIQGGKLHVYYGSAELFGTTELVGRLEGMVQELQAKAEAAQAAADAAEAKVTQAAVALQSAIAGLLEARRIDLSEPVRRRIEETFDVELLNRWLRRAATALHDGELLDG